MPVSFRSQGELRIRTDELINEAGPRFSAGLPENR
jgi:hypothetical protein